MPLYGPYPSLGVSPGAAERYNSLLANPFGTLGPSPQTVRRATAIPKIPKKRTTSSAAKPPGVSAEEWARIQTEKYIQAQLDAISRNREDYLASLKRDSQIEIDRGLALSQALQAMNVPGRVQQIYGNASADIGGLAQAFSGTLRDQATADAAAQTRMVSGTGQEGAVRNQGEAMGNVTYGVGGYIPARSMAETGAAFASQASLEPGFAARIGQEKASEVHAAGLEGLKDFTDAEAEVRSGRFDMEQELLEMKREEQESVTKRTLDFQKEQRQRLKDERSWYVQQAYLARANGDTARSNQYLKLAKQKEARYVAASQGYDIKGNLLPGYKIGPDGMPMKIDKSAATAAKAAAKAKKTAVASARKKREDEYLKVEQNLPKDIEDLAVTATKYGETTTAYPSYAVAFRKMMEQYKYILRLGNKGNQNRMRARLVKLIDDALRAKGIVKPTGAAAHPGK